jgi:hypothetical protein
MGTKGNLFDLFVLLLASANECLSLPKALEGAKAPPPLVLTRH